MKLAQLKEATDKLIDSSIYRYGDASSFKVPFLRLEVELPGPRDPQKWIETLENKLDFQIEKGQSVMVVGAGNGGLAAEAVLQGAGSVLAVEQRPRYHGALNEVIRLISECHGVEAATFLKWPSGNALKDLGKWDLILFPEGLDECTHPGQVFHDLCSLLSPDGRMFVEVTHGAQNYLPDPVNSFRPKREAWFKFVEETTGKPIALETPGRAKGRVLYGIGASGAIRKPKPKPPAPLPTFPKPVKPAAVKPKSFTAPVVKDAPAPPPPPEAPKRKPSDDPEHDPRLGHLLEGPPMTPAAQKRHDDAKKGPDWSDTFQPPLDQIKDTTKGVKRPKVSKKKTPKTEKIKKQPKSDSSS
jgi:hypothetical protein